MILKKVLLHNFGIYAGDNEFVFTGQKPVNLVGGINGRGKTTFLEAILLALYGSNSFLFKTKKRTYPQYLKGYVNERDQTYESFVSLEFELDEDEKADYRLVRSWSGKTRKTDEKLIIEKNGVRDAFLENNWSQFFEGILPSGIARFFFFDGEKIAELAEDDSDRAVKESIKALLGISVLDSMEKDIKKVVRATGKQLSNDNSTAKYLEWEMNVQNLKDYITSLEDRIRKNKQQETDLHLEIEEIRTKLVVRGGNVSLNQEKINLQIRELSKDIASLESDYMDFCSDLLPLALVKKDLSRINALSYQEAEINARNQSIQMLNSLLDGFRNETEAHTDVFEDFILYVNSKVTYKEAETQFDLSASELARLDDLVSGRFDTVVRETRGLRSRKEEKEEKITQLEKTLSLDINQSELAELREEIEHLNLQLGQTQKDREILDEELKTAISQLKEAEHNKKIAAEAFVSSEELGKKNVRIIRYGNMSLEVLDRFRKKLQEKRLHDLGVTMTECYEMLRNKRNLIHHIEMDSETLDLKYLGYDGQIIPSESLSAGEKQLMVFSLLWALAKSAKRKLPVIIDTPLSRLDSKHRESIVRNYYPNASDQIIILSTDTEVTDAYYEILKPYIDQEYFLDYSEENKATTVSEGYFGESRHGD
ncbi:DNA sulfur modification protein DndD [Faecalibaculum rodentium]|uniref:DNA sulfur modification protein DndD n=1 Tax=Faecalibaculum rodentium TaxID=1702221 RepID=UPI0023F0F318|nr:DNA sulfur modification protein DndD [Faecalibaculum rodentium]